jgi:hypothetical protein
VFSLYRGGKRSWRLFGDGIIGLKGVPDDVALTKRQAIQRTVAHTGQTHIDRRALTRFLKRLKYPVSFLDFETFNTAIPLFDGLSPWQQVPFQFFAPMTVRYHRNAVRLGSELVSDFIGIRRNGIARPARLRSAITGGSGMQSGGTVLSPRPSK